MAFFMYPMESPYERRRMHYQSPWWNSNTFRDAISWLDDYSEPTSFTIIRRPVKSVKRSREEIGEHDLKDKQPSQNDGGNANTCNQECQSQSTPNQEIKQTKKPRQDISTPTGNSSKKAKRKSLASRKRDQALIPWYSALRPWQSIADIVDEWTSDRVFPSHDDDTETDVEHSSSDNNSQDIMTSRSYTEYQTRSGNKDKYTYHKSSFRKGSGERKTVISQSIGDQKHTITTVVDAEGNEHQTEGYVNVEENGIQQFKERLRKFQLDQADNPKQLCNEEAKSDQSNHNPSDQSNHNPSNQSNHDSSKQ